MEEQVPASSFPPAQQGLVGQITPEQLDQMKARAREAAIMQAYQQQKSTVHEIGEPLPPGSYYPIQPNNPLPPQVVYVKRSLTVAEIGLMLLLSCGIVFGVQFAINFITNTMPRIEIKMK